MSNLGEFEVMVLTGVIAASDNAYGVTIQEEVESLAPKGRNISAGAVYTTLSRLEEKGYLNSWEGEATPQRGGRPKRFYKVTGAGVMVLRQSLEPMGRAIEVLRGAGA